MRPGHNGAQARHTIVSEEVIVSEDVATHGAVAGAMTICDRAMRLVAGAALACSVSSAAAFAQQATPGTSYASPGQYSMMQPVTPIAEEMHFFHDGILLPIITIISLFVLGLLICVVFRFNSEGESRPLAHDASYRSRGRLDRLAADDSHRHRHPLLPPANTSSPFPSGHDREGHRQLAWAWT